MNIGDRLTDVDTGEVYRVHPARDPSRIKMINESATKCLVDDQHQVVFVRPGIPAKLPKRFGGTGKCR